jgi:hypothetical protein
VTPSFQVQSPQRRTADLNAMPAHREKARACGAYANMAAAYRLRSPVSSRETSAVSSSASTSGSVVPPRKGALRP